MENVEEGKINTRLSLYVSLGRTGTVYATVQTRFLSLISLRSLYSFLFTRVECKDFFVSVKISLAFPFCCDEVVRSLLSKMKKK